MTPGSIVRVALPVLASLLLAAHFHRAGAWLPEGLALAMCALPFLRERRVSRALQAGLVLGTAEWLRTGWVLAAHRAATGQPWARLVAILGAVAAVTALAAWLAGPAERVPPSGAD
ncbi:MAG: hypothetical protein U1F08_04520 [Steroidobacteraceae bacterium]